MILHFDATRLIHIIIVVFVEKASLILMNNELDKLPTNDKKGLFEAYDKCPELSKSDEHKLMFLRCEQFNADVS